jgi:hypothetical protein
VGFFCLFFQRPKKKPAIDTDAGFPVFSLPQLSGLDFDAMMHGKPRRVYGQRTIFARKKPARYDRGGFESIRWERRRQMHPIERWKG